MAEVKVIKANRDSIVRRGVNIKQLRVAAYCRVSTDTEDQINSYNSQLQYYTDLIASKPEWQMAGIYSDAAITGTKVDKREGFRNMIADCTSGKIDLVITKSISRFARNTLDTLKYVRLLKDKGVSVIFEDENINTMAMEGELLLTVLSSVAQQEVENISANVKKGLQMKMARGEMIGFNGCLGYDYHPENKTITVNEREAAIVKRIFNRYIDGAGCKFIADELREMGALKKDGTSDWTECHIRGILQNVKYQGDLMMGSTYTTDPISKRRVINRGEQDMYYMRDHHQPIVSRELFEEAQKVRISRRQKQRRTNGLMKSLSLRCEIMTEITSKLTGDVKEDMKYLMAKSEEYKTHEMAKEILRGIGRLMYDIIPEDQREELNKAIKNDNLGWKAALDEANFCIYKKDFFKAREILESLIQKLEDANVYTDDEVSVYKDFGETFENVLYMYRAKTEINERTVRGAVYPYATIYTQYGGLLFELGEHYKAIEALEKARKWNPISADIAYELAENYKALGDLDTFLRITQETWPVRR